MSTASIEIESGPPPEFVKSKNGKARMVKLSPQAYIDLLIAANNTSPARWPPGMEHGAKLLARIRAIEKRCIAKHGEFDWEKLSRKLQDEYDDACACLDQLRDTGERIPAGDSIAGEQSASARLPQDDE